ncbi:MAG: GNAT family N-acetyltransferase [Gammaproteobacteria bacterium]|nr:GNAT family N-acetyltransferase [Gammaproteobacteria bacterium]MBU2058398.1 GNAT family N-acetyltransferase [Gammaproteobacteria bacterium]MBU2176549.1 GNAT family N-acetyltransferase [Gammaproteobacteria bacterium]MBU2248509.1 GNAT family N-acetyltransferase [Gammaproteobacteria bacterium]MBU2345628.1 GNAT family N-acetyltransferase [Gammaproteobacteria bacterium]
MWHKEDISAFNVVLKPLQLNDLEQLRLWRNSPEISSQMLDQREISAKQQQRWFEGICTDPRQMQFVIYYKNQQVGACNLKSSTALTVTESDSVETGFYLGEAKYRGTILAFFAALALNQYAFEQLGKKMLLAQVKNTNSAALRFNEQLGYQPDALQLSAEMVAMTLVPQAHRDAAAKFATFIRN